MHRAVSMHSFIPQRIIGPKYLKFQGWETSAYGYKCPRVGGGCGCRTEGRVIVDICVQILGNFGQAGLLDRGLSITLCSSQLASFLGQLLGVSDHIVSICCSLFCTNAAVNTEKEGSSLFLYRQGISHCMHGRSGMSKNRDLRMCRNVSRDSLTGVKVPCWENEWCFRGLALRRRENVCVCWRIIVEWGWSMAASRRQFYLPRWEVRYLILMYIKIFLKWN